MTAIVPFKNNDAKSRLSGIMNRREREEFALCMLRDVVNTLKESKVDEVLVMSTSLLDDDDFDILLNPEPLNEAVNEVLRKSERPLLIAMSDLALIRSWNVDEMISRKEDVVIAPGRRGGTNMLFLHEPSRFRSDYYGASFLDHIRIAEDRGLTLGVYDSFFASSDIDQEEDLVEVLIHNERESASFLRSMGVSLCFENGDVGVIRR